MLHLWPRRVARAAAACLVAGALFPVSDPCSADDITRKLDARLQPAWQGISGVSLDASGFYARSGEDWVEVFVRGDAPGDLARDLGGEAGTALPGVAVVRLPVSSLPDLAGSPRVDAIHAARVLRPMLNRNAVETDVITSWGGPAPAFSPAGQTGQGVIIGIIDTGIDYRHEDFKKSNGSTRILTIWDHNNTRGPAPSGYTYGREWTAAEINAGTCSVVDMDGHGTHVAGAAAGNGRATGNGKPAFTYVGMAPEADLIVVKLSAATDTRILEGIAYVFQKAGALGRDAVVCVPYGKASGPHDGSDPLDVGIDQLSGPGRIVVVPAGNDGTMKSHGRVLLGAGDIKRLTFNVANEAQPDVEHDVLEMWYEPGLVLSVTVRTPHGHVIGPLGEGAVSGLSTPDGYVTLLSTNPRAGSGAKNFEVWMNKLGTTVIAPGVWTVELQAVGGAGLVDGWIAEQTVTATMVEGMSPEVTLSSPGTSNEAITVAAYAVNTSWTSVYGSGMLWSTTAGTLADFSSMGPRRDWVRKPDIAASGYGVVSSLSRDASIWQAMVVADGAHYMAKGTSASAAVVTGAVALLLEQHPGLDPQSAKEILWARAKMDSQTGPLFRHNSGLANPGNHKWGAGKLSMEVPMQTAVPEPGEGNRPALLGSPYPNPVSGQLTRVPVVLAEPSVMHVGVFDVLGREVRVLFAGDMAAGSHELVWDGRDGETRPVPSGQYYVVATNRSIRQSRAVLVVR